MTFFMIIVVVGCFAICGMGLQNGVEKITKVMMLLLLALMLILAVRSVTLDGASEGLHFYLAPDFHKSWNMAYLTRFLPLWDRLSSH